MGKRATVLVMTGSLRGSVWVLEKTNNVCTIHPMAKLPDEYYTVHCSDLFRQVCNKKKVEPDVFVKWGQKYE
jgi:hypothetical protein